ETVEAQNNIAEVIRQLTPQAKLQLNEYLSSVPADDVERESSSHPQINETLDHRHGSKIDRDSSIAIASSDLEQAPLPDTALSSTALLDVELQPLTHAFLKDDQIQVDIPSLAQDSIIQEVNSKDAVLEVEAKVLEPVQSIVIHEIDASQASSNLKIDLDHSVVKKQDMPIFEHHPPQHNINDDIESASSVKQEELSFQIIENVDLAEKVIQITDEPFTELKTGDEVQKSIMMPSEHPIDVSKQPEIIQEQASLEVSSDQVEKLTHYNAVPEQSKVEHENVTSCAVSKTESSEILKTVDLDKAAVTKSDVKQNNIETRVAKEQVLKEISSFKENSVYLNLKTQILYGKWQPIKEKKQRKIYVNPLYLIAVIIIVLGATVSYLAYQKYQKHQQAQEAKLNLYKLEQEKKNAAQKNAALR
ncbi:hypothetical protein HX127_01620, partial [Acinetobacter sp. 256-1]|uniref:hypothetical protein n=1 Tax=Acinetobacter sp. 256-1 TaxID=2746721 RepID=UPI0025764FA2